MYLVFQSVSIVPVMDELGSKQPRYFPLQPYTSPPNLVRIRVMHNCAFSFSSGRYSATYGRVTVKVTYLPSLTTLAIRLHQIWCNKAFLQVIKGTGRRRLKDVKVKTLM